MTGRARRIRGFMLVALLLGCARASMPPGGDPDETPPRLVAVSPEPESIVEEWDDPVVFRFDERISEQGIEESVLVSPETGEVRLDKGSSDLEVSLEGGWRAGQIYRILLRPGVRDLFGNVTITPFELVFSTGPPIPSTALAGQVTDRVTLQPVAEARVAAIRDVDSVTYVAVSDTSGFYFMRHIPPGGYELRAYRDQNRNRLPDPFESQDSGVVALGAVDTALVSFDLLVPDTLPARLARAETDDTAHVRLAFDDYLDPLLPTDAIEVTLWRLADSTAAAPAPDSTALEVAEVLHAHEWQQRVDSVAAVLRAEQEAARRAAADSAAAAAAAAGDTLIAGGDTAAVAAAAAAAAGAAAERPAAPPIAAGDTTTMASDSTVGPLPARELVIVPERPLDWATNYRVTVDDVTNIAGLAGGGGTAVFQTPPAPVPDTTAVSVIPDTTAAGIVPETADASGSPGALPIALPPDSTRKPDSLEVRRD